MHERKKRLSIEIQYASLGTEFWLNYALLDRQFREDLHNQEKKDGEVDYGDLTIARKELEEGSRAHILGCVDDQAIAFRRIDFRKTATIGALFVEPKFRGVLVDLTDTLWLESAANYQVWQTLTKAAYIICRRAGYSETGSYIHNKQGDRAKEWRMRQKEKWEIEVPKSNEPSNIIDLIRQFHTNLLTC